MLILGKSLLLRSCKIRQLLYHDKCLSSVRFLLLTLLQVSISLGVILKLRLCNLDRCLKLLKLILLIEQCLVQLSLPVLGTCISRIHKPCDKCKILLICRKLLIYQTDLLRETCYLISICLSGVLYGVLRHEIFPVSSYDNHVLGGNYR